jgi:hypothetical protein
MGAGHSGRLPFAPSSVESRPSAVKPALDLSSRTKPKSLILALEFEFAAEGCHVVARGLSHSLFYKHVRHPGESRGDDISHLLNTLDSVARTATSVSTIAIFTGMTPRAKMSQWQRPLV